MSAATCVQLTEEQQKLLASLEEEFKDRYTEKDEEFKAVLSEWLPLPPVVENWREFRQFDERHGGERNYRDHSRHRDRDRDRGENRVAGGQGSTEGLPATTVSRNRRQSTRGYQAEFG